jgi:hypothetical protein
LHTAFDETGQLGVYVGDNAPARGGVYHPWAGGRSDKAPAEGRRRFTEAGARDRGHRRCGACCDWDVAANSEAWALLRRWRKQDL